MTNTRVFVGIAAFVLLAGCASPASGPEFKQAALSPHTGTVYIFRPDREFNRGGYPYVYVNGDRKFALKENGYAVLSLPAGNYEFKFEGSQSGTNWWPPPVTRLLGIEAGREYFVRAIPILPPGAKPGLYLFSNNISRTRVDLIPREQALRELATLRSVHD
jgi:hypothetical protein